MRLLRRGRPTRRSYSAEHPMVSGETVTPGRFRCRRCGHEHEVREGVVNLPVCPRCLNETWEPQD